MTTFILSVLVLFGAMTAPLMTISAIMYHYDHPILAMFCLIFGITSFIGKINN